MYLAQNKTMRKWVTFGLLSLAIGLTPAPALSDQVVPTPQAPTAAAPASSTRPSASEDGITLFFSPKGGCTDAIVKEISQARDTLLIQAYSFTSAPIAKAVLDAHRL